MEPGAVASILYPEEENHVLRSGVSRLKGAWPVGDILEKAHQPCTTYI